MLAPSAEATDQATTVPHHHLGALAEAGLQGLAGPTEFGGREAPAAVTREVYEVLAGACGVTFFVWVQHHAPVRLLAASANGPLRERWLPALCRGDTLGGVAFAYLRRPGSPAVAARRAPGGWVVNGEAPWVTSWGMAGVYAVAARVVDPDQADLPVVFFALPADPAPPAVHASAPLALAAMGASATVRLTFDNLFVPADDVITTTPLSQWRARDRVATASPHPAPIGLAATAVRFLSQQAARRRRGAVRNAATDLAAEVDACRSLAYGLIDEDRTDDAHLAQLVDARAWGLDVALRSAAAVVAATGGESMLLANPAQRLLREAAFYSIQAQTAVVQAATLDRLTRAQFDSSS